MKKIIKLRTDYDILDDEFENVSKPFDDELDSWFEKHRELIDEFVAFYIARGIENNAIWDGAFSGLVNSAVDTLVSYFVDDNFNRKNLDNILLNKYGYRLIQEKPMIFEKIK
jgi:hypothetical protein